MILINTNTLNLAAIWQWWKAPSCKLSWMSWVTWARRHGYFGVNLLQKRAKNSYFAELDEFRKLSGGRIGAQSTNIYSSYMQANFRTRSMKFRSNLRANAGSKMALYFSITFISEWGLTCLMRYWIDLALDVCFTLTWPALWHFRLLRFYFMALYDQGNFVK